jgi:predicted permease
MGTILEVVAPVFLIVLLGFAAARRRVVEDAAFAALARFTFLIAAPALLFAGGTRPHEGGFWAGVALIGASFLVLGAVTWAARRRGQSLAEAALFGLACVFGNSVMMGIPLVIAAYGEAGIPALLAILGLQTVLVIGVVTLLVEIGMAAEAPWRQVMRSSAAGIARNPVLLAVLAAMAWNLTGLGIAAPIRRTLELLGAAAPPVALFCLGGSLFGLSAAALWRETVAIAAVKLLVLPALVWAAALILPLSPAETAVAVTMAALPTGANAFIIARRYATGADRSGSAVVFTTALSVLTLAALIAHFRETLP